MHIIYTKLPLYETQVAVMYAVTSHDNKQITLFSLKYKF